MKLVLLLFTLYLLISCTPPVQSTLLKDRAACTEENGCLKVQQKEIAGDLSITPDSTQVTLNIEKSDSLEVSGACRDLGRYDNRIIVQVFEGEDEAVQPILDNSASSSCLGTSTTTPVINGTRCFWNTTGAGIVEPTTEFPRCFNGRFSFRVRLGKVIRDGSNNILNYLVRMKLRSANPSGDSAFARVVVNRFISKPSLSVVVPSTSNPTAQLRCEISVNPFRGAKVGYELQKTVTASGGVIPSPDFNIYPTFPAPMQVAFPDVDFGADTGSTVQKFYDDNVIHGVTYSYSVQASDFLYTPSAPHEVSGYSEIVNCKTPTPQPQSCVCITGGVCYVSVDRISKYAYEWSYRADAANWPANFPGTASTGAGCGTGTNPSCLLPACSTTGASSCQMTGLAVNEKRHVSLRAVHSDGYKGELMSSTIECVGK